MATATTIYLKKASDEVVSVCRCGDGMINFPAQMDCPWCGCGWLFTCITCRKAFTFAEGIETSEPLESIGRRSLLNSWQREPSPSELEEWSAAMSELLADVQVGRRYVYLDGLFLPADMKGIVVTGWAARHALDELPQVVARRDPSILEATLGDRAYWQKRKSS